MRSFYLIIVLFFIGQGLNGQTCLPDGIWITTQAELDGFQAAYPNCTEILGSVTIGVNITSSDITDLSALNNITIIGGGLTYGYNDNIESFNLPNLTSVGSLQITHQINIQNLEGLQNLSDVGGLISIDNCQDLINCRGLENINTINGDFIIADNPSLINFEGFQNLSTINGNFILQNNHSLENLYWLTSLNSVDFLSVSENSMLTGCDIPFTCNLMINMPPYFFGPNGTGCSSIEEIHLACLMVDVSNLENLQPQIFPNPTGGKIMIQLPQSGEATLQLSNYIGSVLISKTISNSSEIDMSELANGIYLLQIQMGTNNWTERVVRNQQ